MFNRRALILIIFVRLIYGVHEHEKTHLILFIFVRIGLRNQSKFIVPKKNVNETNVLWSIWVL